MAGWNNITRMARKDFEVHKDITNEDLLKAIESGGGGGSQPGPGTVGTEQIIDGSVVEADLSDDVKDGLHELENPENYAGDGDVDNIFG